MTTQNKTTHVRTNKTAPRRINRLAKVLSAKIGGNWFHQDVVDKALDALERELNAPATEPVKA